MGEFFAREVVAREALRCGCAGIQGSKPKSGQKRPKAQDRLTTHV